MTIGDCYILNSDFLKYDIGFILIGDNKSEYIFTPIIFKDNQFDNSASCVFDSEILTSVVYIGIEEDAVTGIFVVREYKNKPTFLTEYCKENQPFIHLNINVDNILLNNSSHDPNKIIISGGTTLFPTKEMFDKFNIHSFINSSFKKAKLNLILKSL